MDTNSQSKMNRSKRKVKNNGKIIVKRLHQDSILGKQNWFIDTFVKVFNRNHSNNMKKENGVQNAKMSPSTSIQNKLNTKMQGVL